MVKKTDLARKLRQTQTSYEATMWQCLRGRQFLGLKFRRQQPFGPYVLDFFCEELRLAVELDGAQHQTPSVVDYDEARTAFLRSRGITVVRVDNHDIDVSVGKVLWKLQRVVKQMQESKPSPGGEGGAEGAG